MDLVPRIFLSLLEADCCRQFMKKKNVLRSTRHRKRHMEESAGFFLRVSCQKDFRGEVALGLRLES